MVFMRNTGFSEDNEYGGFCTGTLKAVLRSDLQKYNNFLINQILVINGGFGFILTSHMGAWGLVL